MELKTSSALSWLLLGACIIMALLLNRSCNINDEQKDFQNQYYAIQDTLHKTRNDLGQEVTKTQLIMGEIDNFKKLISIKDSSLMALQKLVNKSTISATILSNRTSNTITAADVNVRGRDTIMKNDTIRIFPEYGIKFNNKWESFEIKSNKDTFIIDYKVFNEFSVVQKYEKQKVKGRLFKQGIAIIEVTNNNPHTETMGLKSFNIDPTPKHNSIKNMGVGALTGILAGYLLFKQ